MWGASQAVRKGPGATLNTWPTGLQVKTRTQHCHTAHALQCLGSKTSIGGAQVVYILNCTYKCLGGQMMQGIHLNYCTISLLQFLNIIWIDDWHMTLQIYSFVFILENKNLMLTQKLGTNTYSTTTHNIPRLELFKSPSIGVYINCHILIQWTVI